MWIFVVFFVLCFIFCFDS
jgi:hypothetical protein